MRMRYVIVLFLLVRIGFSQPVWVAPLPGPQDWNIGTNWSTGAPPGAGQTAIFNGASSVTCRLVANVTIANITVNGFTGNIDLNSFDLTMQPGGDNSFMSGSIVGTGNIIINSTSAATFDGTTIGANVNVTATLTSTTGIFTGGPGTTFNGKVTVIAHSILLNGSTYNSTTSLTKSSVSAATNSLGTGGNTFNGTTTLVNDMNAIFRTGATNPDTFNGQLTLSLTGTSLACDLQVAFSSAGNAFRNILVRSDTEPGLEGAEISFGAGGGTSTLASGNTLQEVDATLDQFVYGDLILNNFTQLGNTAQTLHLRCVDPSVDDLTFQISNSTFNGTVDYQASNPFISNSTFNGVTTLIKTGSTGTDGSFGPPPHAAFTWGGGNTFNNTTTIRNNGLCTLVLGGTNGDTFNAAVTFITQSASSKFIIGLNGTTTFKNNITLTQLAGSPTINFGYTVGSGSVVLEGSALQTISSTSSIPTFRNLTIKNANGITLSIPIVIANNLDFITGIVNPGGSNYVSFLDGATSTNAKNASFIDGIVRKTGNDAFVFPIGDGGSYHPLAMSAPSDVLSEFSAQYFASDHTLGAVSDVTLEKISDCEYWTFNRLAASDTPTITLYFNSPFCRVNYITDASFLRVGRWSGTQWNDLGVTSYSDTPAPDGTDGYVQASLSLPDVASHTLTLGSIDEANMLPITIAEFSIKEVMEGAEISWTTASEHDNDFFTVQRLQGNEFVALATIDGAGTSNYIQHYHWLDPQPLPGRSYYRLKQTDFDGSATYSHVIALERANHPTPYPNPVANTLFLNGMTFSEDSKVIVQDATGRTVYSGSAAPTVDFSSFSPGIYHVAIASKKSIIWFRISKE